MDLVSDSELLYRQDLTKSSLESTAVLRITAVSASTTQSNNPGSCFLYRYRYFYGVGVVLFFIYAFLITCPSSAAQFNHAPKQGLLRTLKSATHSDSRIVSEAAFFVQDVQQDSPSVFLPPGGFEGYWEGTLTVDLRTDAVFHAIVSGQIQVEIGNSVALSAQNTDGQLASGKSVRLTKGANPVRVHFKSPPQGSARFQVFWSTDEFPPEPLSPEVLSPKPTDGANLDEVRRLGRQLFIDHRCIKCHSLPNQKELPKFNNQDAPDLTEVGSRYRPDRMAQWLLDPKQFRSHSKMPLAFRGANRELDAQAVAAYLSTLKAPGISTTRPPSQAIPTASEKPSEGSILFEQLLCNSCHTPPGKSDQQRPESIQLKDLHKKYISPDNLVAYLEKPDRYDAWSRMPNFRLSTSEAKALASFLFDDSPLTQTVSPLWLTSSNMEKGKKLFRDSGCIHCHPSVQTESISKTRIPLHARSNFENHCLNSDPNLNSKSPAFNLTPRDRLALKILITSAPESLHRHVASDFVLDHFNTMKCSECHQAAGGFPGFQRLGLKLKPEWMREWIGGNLTEKPRPWLQARMPAFVNYADTLATGLAHLSGYPRNTSQLPAGQSNPAHASLGKKLVGMDGGFSCVSCHGVGPMPPLQVFESQGINLSLSGLRLQQEYYNRWLSSPLRIDPTTKMPVYFDQGSSPLTEILDGSANGQINAIWQYLLLGKGMQPPAPSLQPPPE